MGRHPRPVCLRHTLRQRDIQYNTRINTPQYAGVLGVRPLTYLLRPRSLFTQRWTCAQPQLQGIWCVSLHSAKDRNFWWHSPVLFLQEAILAGSSFCSSKTQSDPTSMSSILSSLFSSKTRPLPNYPSLQAGITSWRLAPTFLLCTREHATQHRHRKLSLGILLVLL